MGCVVNGPGEALHADVAVCGGGNGKCLVYEDGKLYAVSKNYNTLIVIDIDREEVTAAFGLPSELTDIRGLVKKGDRFEVVDHNKIVTLELQ